MIFRCFGVYAALTVTVNYILVVLILPGAIILSRPIRKKLSRGDEEPEKIESHSYFASKITETTHYFRFGIFICSLIMTGLSLFIIFQNPGLKTPQTNPTKVRNCIMEKMLTNLKYCSASCRLKYSRVF